MWNTGIYKRIKVNEKIDSTKSFSDQHAKVVPGSEVKVSSKRPDAISVTLEFKETNGKTKVTVTEAGIPLIMKLFAKLGWQQQFDTFETLL